MIARSICILGVSLGATAAHAFAQSQAMQSPAQQPAALQSPALQSPIQTMQRYQGVEQMVGDVSPLGVSLRSLQAGLGLPAAFEGVYRAPDDGSGRARLMRIDGALAATFPKSEYWDLYVRQTAMYGLISRVEKVGHIPVVPAGTVFKIGLPEAPPTEQPLRTARAVEPERPVERAEDGRPVFTSPRSSVPIRTGAAPPRIASDEAIEEATAVLGEERDRQRRMRELLRRASQAETDAADAGEAHAARGKSGPSSK